MNEKIDNELVKLESMTKDLARAGVRALSPTSQAAPMTRMELLAAGVASRAYSCVEGFCTLVRAENYPAAASLVRLHLDSVLRFYAASLAINRDKFVEDMMAGIPIRKHRDRYGKELTDAYLVRQFSKQVPWVKRVYEETCGLVHLSEKHIFQAIRLGSGAGEFTLRIGNCDEDIPDDARLEGISGMIAITELLIHILETWADHRAKEIERLGGVWA